MLSLQRDLRISTTGKHLSIIRFKHFQAKRRRFPTLLNQIKGLRVTKLSVCTKMVSSTLAERKAGLSGEYSLHGGSLEIRLTVPLSFESNFQILKGLFQDYFKDYTY